MSLSLFASRASSQYGKGQEAEARQDYEAAYGYYAEAYRLNPEDLAARAAMTRLRFLSSSGHVTQGKALRNRGKLNEALAEFQKAAAIDPASFAALQEIRRTQMMLNAPGRASASAPAGASATAAAASGPAELHPLSSAAITLKVAEDSKLVYEAIGKLAGINVLFDPDFASRPVRLELNGVTLLDALQILAMQSGTFWRPVTRNTIFVAADTPSKRKQLEQNVLRTFYLSNVSQQTDLQDVVNTLRSVVGIERLTQISSQGAIIVRGTPDQIALAGKVIDDIDKARPEVVVELAIMQVSRDKAHNLGISPPTSASVVLRDNTSTSSSSSSTTASTSGTVNLNRIANLTAKDFQVTVSQATANFLLSDSNTRLLQNPQIRAVDGQKASLKIGERVPVATGSYSGGSTALSALVSTQFQYIDVGVNIDITPYIHGNGDITLKLVIETSAVNSYTTIGDISEPVIGQRKIEHQIRLKEGEINLLGGVFEEQEIKTVSGYPLLVKLPLLKYLFGSENTERKQNEIVFALVPHIVRAQDLTDANLKSIDIGTANAIELRHPEPASGTTQAPASSSISAATASSAAKTASRDAGTPEVVNNQ